MIFQEPIIPSMPVGIWSLKQVIEFYENAPNHNFKKLTYGAAPKSWSVKVWKPFALWLHFDKHLSNSSRYMKNAWKHIKHFFRIPLTAIVYCYDLQKKYVVHGQMVWQLNIIPDELHYPCNYYPLIHFN